jgi:hypothetical protein
LLVVYHERRDGTLDDIGVTRYRETPAPDFRRQNVARIPAEQFDEIYNTLLDKLRVWGGTP